MQPSGSVSAASNSGRAGVDADRVDRRHGDELGQRARQAGDAVLRVKGALVRVAGAAVLAERDPAGADAVAALIDDDAIAGL